MVIAQTKGQDLQNTYYPAKTQAEISHMGAQTGLARAQAANIPVMADLERQRVDIDRQRVGIEAKHENFIEGEGSRLIRTEWARL
ncbi:hypothetical protein ABTM68_20520, partial [Acinetobacter baumannii]